MTISTDDVARAALDLIPDRSSLIAQLGDSRSRAAWVVEVIPDLTRVPVGVGGVADRQELRRQLEELLALATTVLRRLDDEGPDAALADDERTSLEAVICTFGRPAIKIVDHTFERPPKDWEALEAHRAAIDRNIAATGRIESPSGVQIGTGFLVAESTLMTNAHVAEQLFERREGEWAVCLGAAPHVDWRREHDRLAEATFPIASVIDVHPEHDMALLRLDPTRPKPREVRMTMEPLWCSSTAPPRSAQTTVYVVGYPACDHDSAPPEVLRRIFADIYGFKRLQPGVLRGYDERNVELTHDCSTLGGNSGSPVVDLATHQVVGLHFQGAYLRGNTAVPLWTLVDDPMLKRAGVRFAPPAATNVNQR